MVGMLYDAGGNKVDEIKYVTGWIRVDGEWQVIRVIWNSNLPAPQPPTGEEETEAAEETEEM